MGPSRKKTFTFVKAQLVYVDKGRMGHRCVQVANCSQVRWVDQNLKY